MIFYNYAPNCGTQARKGKGGPRVAEKIKRSEIFVAGAPGGIPIPFFAVAGTRIFFWLFYEPQLFTLSHVSTFFVEMSLPYFMSLSP